MRYHVRNGGRNVSRLAEHPFRRACVSFRMACLAGAVAFSLSCGSFIPIVSAKQLVFIHYCNNTAPAGQDGENHRVTIERLEGIGHEKAQSIADNLREEPALMAEAIAADREVLRKELPGRLGVVLCELDNENARAGQLKVWIPGQAESQQLSTDIPAIGDYVFDGNPLATAAGLKACLLAIADRFPPRTPNCFNDKNAD